MSIHFAVMALLASRPTYGYAANRALEDRFGDLFDFNHGRGYQVLRALEANGWVVVGDERREGRRPARRVYVPSPLGVASLEAWLQGGAVRGEPLSEEFFLRILVGRERGLDVRGWVEAERKRLVGLLRLAGDPETNREPEPTPGVSELAARWRLLRARADLATVDECLRALSANPSR